MRIVDMLDSILLYLAFATTLIGLLSIFWPLRFISIRTRKAGDIFAAIGLIVAVVILSLPVRTKQVSTPATELDEWMPVWHFDEEHVVHVDAAPAKVFDAI